MPTHMWKSSFTAEGLRGALRRARVDRAAYLRRQFTENGARIEAVYWAFGESDVYVIGEVPGNATAAAIT